MRGARERPASGKHSQAAEETLLVGRQLVVAPLDRRLKRLVPWQRGPAAAGEQSKAIVQPGADLTHREDPDSRGRQRSEERRVGKERRAWGWWSDCKKKWE